jgi:ABC-2 type transport system permease protein
MIGDIGTVLWKEWKEILLFRARAGRVGNVVSLLMLLGVFGVYLPLITGPQWVSSPLVLAAWAWVPYLLIVGVIADAFAGERERHTLETLLATRLSDRAILLGKIGAAVGYGWGVALASLLLGLISLNIAFAGNGLLVYPAATLAAILTLSLLVSILAASLGVLVSIRAASLQQAQQRLSLSSMLLFLVPVFAMQLAPRAWVAAAATAVEGSNLPGLFLAVGTGLLLLDAGLVAGCLARFQRTRMILD